MADASRILAKNLFPNPSPLDAPFTSPAISINSMVAALFFSYLKFHLKHSIDYPVLEQCLYWGQLYKTESFAPLLNDS